MNIRTVFWASGLALSISTHVIAGFAPDTIEGKVLRTTYQNEALRHFDIATIVFNADQRYEFLLYATLSHLRAHTGYLLSSSRTHGRYFYYRTGENTAKLILSGSPWPYSRIIRLEFASPSIGQDAEGNFSFRWTDTASIESARTVNLSLRGEVSPDRPLIGGFVVPKSPNADASSENHRDVLIRVVGPSLTQLGLDDVWDDPEFELYRDKQPGPDRGHHYGDWWASSTDSTGKEEAGTQVEAFERIFEHLGAFPLMERSKDAAQIERLAPGCYTVVAKADSGDSGGTALIEVFFLP